MTTDEKLDELIRLQKEANEAMNYHTDTLTEMISAVEILGKVIFERLPE